MAFALTSRFARISAGAAAALALSSGAFALAADAPATRGAPRAAAAQAGLPRLISRFRDATVTVRGTATPLALALPPGRFMVLGKASYRQDPGQSMTCQLRTSLGDFDETDLRAFGQPVRGALTLTVVRSSSSSESVLLVCEGPDRFGSAVDGSVRDVKLTAVEVGEVSNLPG